MNTRDLGGIKQFSRARAAALGAAFLWAAFCNVVSGQQNVSLQWNPSIGASSYALYLGPAPGGFTQRINVGTNTIVTLTGLPAGITNCFVVTACNAAGLESPASNLAEFMAATNPAPATNPALFTTAPLSITNNGQLHISAAGVSNQTWLLENSANLSTWTFVFTNAASQALSYSTAVPQGQSWGYYRALGVIGTVTPTSIALAASNQYYMQNAVGFVKVNAGRGETLLANPFDCGNNTVTALLPSVPAGSVLYQYTTGIGYASNTFSSGQWKIANMTLLPGNGAFFYNPTRTTQKIVFAGRVLQNSVTNFIPSGYSITSPMIPLPNPLTTLPAVTGDTIQCYNGRWLNYTNLSGTWTGNPKNGPLTILPGGAFFITKSAAAEWIQYWQGD